MDASLPRLRTDLSQVAVQQGGVPEFDPDRTRREREALEDVGPWLFADRAHRRPWSDSLVEIARACGAQSATMRAAKNSLAPDKHGVVIEFLPGDMVSARLDEISDFLKHTEGPACYRALAAQMALLNLHPLTDGNGRSSRVVFAALLQQGYPGFRLYPPVYQLRRHAPYAFEIALRSAEIHHEWAMLAHFYINLFVLLDEHRSELSAHV